MNPRISRAIYNATQRISGANISRRIAELEHSQWLPRDQLEEMQWERLKSLCSYAYENVAYYTRVWDELGIKPSTLRSFEDFSALPFLKKSDVQANFEHLRSRSTGRTPLHSGRTSGSSGNPLRFVRTQDSKARFWAAQYRGYGWYGIRPGDKQGRFYGMPIADAISKRERLKDVLWNRRRLRMFDLSDRGLADFAEDMNHFGPLYFNGYSTWLGRFAEFVAHEGPSKYSWIPLKGVVATSEVLSDHSRNLIEATFRCPVIDEYGAAEIGLIAISCPSGGFHTVPENIYLELIPSTQQHPTDNRPVQLYEVVVTDLHSHAMPFIRYKVGDYLSEKPHDDHYCQCGRTSPVIGPVMGRSNTYVITPEGDIRGGMFFKYLADMSLDAGNGVVRFSARQKDIANLTFYIVKDRHFTDATLDFLIATTKKYLSSSMNIDVEFIDELPRTMAGKLLSFSSDLDVDKTLAGIRAKAGGT